MARPILSRSCAVGSRYIEDSAATLALPRGALGSTAAWAEDPSHDDHVMVVPADLKWTDVRSLPAGAKIVLIEGPSNEQSHLSRLGRSGAVKCLDVQRPNKSVETNQVRYRDLTLGG